MRKRAPHERNFRVRCIEEMEHSHPCGRCRGGADCPAPRCQPDFLFDFRLSHVQSISMSVHKYGGVYPRIVLVVFRSKAWEIKVEGLQFTVDYLGAQESHMTMNFSRNRSFIAGAY